MGAVLRRQAGAAARVERALRGTQPDIGHGGVFVRADRGRHARKQQQHQAYPGAGGRQVEGGSGQSGLNVM